MSARGCALPVALAVAVLLPAFLAPPSAAQGPGGLYGETLLVGVTGVLDPNPLNRSPANGGLHSLLYDSLARPSASTLVPEPWLAESWDVNLTSRSVTFHLRANPRWADNTALTAAHVAASFTRFRDAGVVSGFAVNAPDDSTVVFAFTSGGGDFLGKWVSLPIAFRGATGPADESGPFALGTVVPGVSLEITANANHWRGRPYVDAVRYLFYTGAAALDDAVCDFIDQQLDFLAVPLTGLDLTAVRPCGQLQDLNVSRPWLRTATDPGFRFLHLGVNTSGSPLDDPALRVALTSALDRELTRTIEGPGTTEIADSVVSPANAFWFNASVPQYRVVKGVEGGRVVTILDNVNDMLDAAGYFDFNGDGWRQRPDGTPFNLTFLHLSSTDDPAAAKVASITTNFQAVGIQLREVEDSAAGILSRVVANNFSLFLGMHDVEADPSFLFDLFHSSRLSGRNYNNVAVPELDAILVRVRDELDVDARRQAAQDAQGWLAENAVAMPLVHYDTTYVYNRDRFEGWVSRPGGIDNFWSFVGVHAVQRGPMTASLTPFANSVLSGQSTDVVITVVDGDSLPVEGADVVLGGGSFAPASGTTDDAGRFTATFAAPTVTATQDIAIRADVTKPGYDSTSALSAIAVHPAVRRFDVLVQQAVQRLPPGESTDITVSVRNSTGFAIPGATVRLRLTPAGVGGELADPEGVTGTDGAFATTLTATVGSETILLITAEVEVSGYESTSASTSVLAEPRGGSPPPPAPGLDTIAMVVLVAAAAFVYARYQIRRRKA